MRVPPSTTSSAGSNVTSPTINVQPFFSGIALDVTPQIGEGDQIILHLHPSVSVVAEKQKNVNLGSLGSIMSMFTGKGGMPGAAGGAATGGVGGVMGGLGQAVAAAIDRTRRLRR